jgi:hypothetical protein
MSEPILEQVYVRKLAHAYVALALAQKVAKEYVNEQPTHATLCPLVHILEVTAGLLEEILENALPEESPTRSLPMPCSDMLM